MRRKAGLKAGDELEVKAARGVVRLINKSRGQADDECTPDQRRIIDAQIAEGLQDIKLGRLHGPFETHEEMIKFLHGEVKKAKVKKSGKVRTR